MAGNSLNESAEEFVKLRSNHFRLNSDGTFSCLVCDATGGTKLKLGCKSSLRIKVHIATAKHARNLKHTNTAELLDEVLNSGGPDGGGVPAAKSSVTDKSVSSTSIITTKIDTKIEILPSISIIT